MLLEAMLSEAAEADAAGSEVQPAATRSIASDSVAFPPAVPVRADSVDLPPSRAGDVQPATNYEQALSDLLSQVVTAG